MKITNKVLKKESVIRITYQSRMPEKHFKEKILALFKAISRSKKYGKFLSAFFKLSHRYSLITPYNKFPSVKIYY